MYSAGAPILYVVTFFNFVFAYWIYKHLAISYYKITWEFDESFVNYTLNQYKIGVFFHLIMTLLMFTNQQSLGVANGDDGKNSAIVNKMKEFFGENSAVM